MQNTRRFPRLDELTAARRAEVLAMAADRCEVRSLRAIAYGLPARLPQIAAEANLPLWKVSRTLNRTRPADPATVAAIRDALGVQAVDLRAAKQAAAERGR
jgi:hypothetical protein